MFGWEDLLSESDRRAVVRYIKNFSEAFEEEPTPIDVPEATPATPEALVEGKSLYMVMQCWTCHGPEGRGDGASAGDLKDEWGRDMEAFDFTVGAYKRGTDGESVFKTFETGLNGTPMPSYSGAFLFGSEHVRLSTYRDVYDESDLTGLESYLRSQPTASEIAQMTELERRRLESRRKWSLVHYVRSLSREPGLFHWLFTADTEVTP